MSCEIQLASLAEKAELLFQEGQSPGSSEGSEASADARPGLGVGVAMGVLRVSEPKAVEPLTVPPGVRGETAGVGVEGPAWGALPGEIEPLAKVCRIGRME